MTNEKQQQDKDRHAYFEAMRRWLARKPVNMAWKDGHRPTRDELHDRAAARRELESD